MMSDYHVIIQCRLESKRLPAKALLSIRDIPAAVLCGLRAANRGTHTIMAISTEAADDPLADVLTDHGLRVFRGPLEDVLKRYVLAAQDLPAGSIIVRLTADNLFPDGDFVDNLVKAFKKSSCRYLGTSFPQGGLPYGLSAEAFTVDALREADTRAAEPYDREHVTSWIIRNYGNKGYMPVEYMNRLSHLRCTLDDLADYMRLLRVFKSIEDPVNVPWRQLCHILEEIPGHAAGVPYRRLNGIDYSEITLGTSQLGLAYGRNKTGGKPPAHKARTIIRQAAAAGINTFDTARAYGDSETLLGDALSPLSGLTTVITKLFPWDERRPHHSADDCRHAVDASIFRSCRELGVKHLPVVLLHRYEHLHVYDGAIWKRLLTLQQEGVIGALGISVYTPEQALQAASNPDVTHIQLPFNLLDWRWKSSGFPSLSFRPDLAIFARSALLQGILCAGSRCWPQLPGVDPQTWLNKLDFLAGELGRDSVTDLCFAYVRAHDWITSIVIGIDTMEQLEQNLELFQNDVLDKSQCHYLEKTLRGAPEALLNPTRW